MPSHLIGHASDPSLRLLDLPLAALGDAPHAQLGACCGLPAGAIEADAANLILAATPCDGPMFAAAIEAAAEHRQRDVLLVRAGLFAETLNAVTCDIALVTSQGAFGFACLIFFRHHDGTLWLVPQDRGPFIGIDERGLRLEMVAPFDTLSDRSDGVCRAAYEIVRLSRSGRVR